MTDCCELMTLQTLTIQMTETNDKLMTIQTYYYKHINTAQVTLSTNNAKEKRISLYYHNLYSNKTFPQ